MEVGLRLRCSGSGVECFVRAAVTAVSAELQPRGLTQSSRRGTLPEQGGRVPLSMQVALQSNNNLLCGS